MTETKTINPRDKISRDKILAADETCFPAVSSTDDSSSIILIVDLRGADCQVRDSVPKGVIKDLLYNTYSLRRVGFL